MEEQNKPPEQNQREMDITETKIEKTAGKTEVIALAVAVLLAAVHFISIMSFHEPADSTMDSHGYLKLAKTMATTGKNYIETASRVEFYGPTLKPTGTSRYYLIMPPGYPAILAVVYRAFGPEAMTLVSPIMASLSLLALFLLCRAWTGSGWALAAVALTAMNPALNEHTLYNYSHIATIFILLWGLYFLVRAQKSRYLISMFISGMFIGYIPAMRILEGLFIPAILIYILLRKSGTGGRLSGTAAFVAGAAIPMMIFFIWNRLMFGGILKTGYSMHGYEFFYVFKWKYFQAYAVPYIVKLSGEGGFMVFGLGVIGIAYLCARRDTWREGFLLAALCAPLTFLYMMYFSAPNPESMRFLLPVIPLLTIGCVWLLKHLCDGRMAAAAAVSSVLLLLTACWGLPQSHYALKRLEHRYSALVKLKQILEENVPDNSIVVADEAMAQYLDIFGHWRIADTSVLGARRKATYGKMDFRRMTAAFERDIRSWAGPDDRIFWVGKDITLKAFGGYLPASRFVKTAQLLLPSDDYLNNCNRSMTTKLPGSRDVPTRVKRGCYNFDPGTGNYYESSFSNFLNGYPVILFELRKR